MALGATWIAMHATGGRGATHTAFQVLALSECGIALLLRWRKPVGALASILVVYALVDLDTITILPVLLALLTVAELRGRRTVIAAATATAVVVAVMPYLHGDTVSLGARTLPHLAAVGLSVALGLWLRARRPAGWPGGSDRGGEVRNRPTDSDGAGAVRRISQGVRPSA